LVLIDYLPKIRLIPSIQAFCCLNDVVAELVTRPQLPIPRAGLFGTLLACQDFEVLARLPPKKKLTVANRPIFYMTPRKSHLVQKAHTIWEQKRAPSAAKDPKITRKSTLTVEKTALNPIATSPLLIAVGFDADYLSKLPTYKPLLDLGFQLHNYLIQAYHSSRYLTAPHALYH
jgi:hypothetical protein